MTNWKSFALILLFLLLSLVIIVLVGQIRLNQTVPDIQRTLLSIQVSQPESSGTLDAGLLELTQAAAQSTIDTANTLLLVGSAFGTLLTVVLVYVGIAARNDAREANERAKESQVKATSAAEQANETLEKLKPLQNEVTEAREDILNAKREIEEEEIRSLQQQEAIEEAFNELGKLQTEYKEQTDNNKKRLNTLRNRLETLTYVFNFAIQLTLPNQLDEQLGIQGLIELSRTDDLVIFRQCMRLFSSIPEMNFANEDTRKVIFEQLQTRLREIAADTTKDEYYQNEARRILEQLAD